MVPVGQTTETVETVVEETLVEPAVQGSLELSASLEGVNQTELRRTLAAQYGVPVEYVSLKLRAGSPKLDFEIVVPSDSIDPDGTMAEADLKQMLANRGEALLTRAESISAVGFEGALGVHVNISRAFSMEHRNVTRLVQRTVVRSATCPRGWWCSAGFRTAW